MAQNPPRWCFEDPLPRLSHHLQLPVSANGPAAGFPHKMQAGLEKSHSLSGRANSPALRSEGTLIVDVTNEFLKVKHTR